MIIAREKEIHLLDMCVKSPTAEFVALYVRRRLITPFGIEESIWSEDFVANEVTMDVLFQAL